MMKRMSAVLIMVSFCAVTAKSDMLNPVEQTRSVFCEASACSAYEPSESETAFLEAPDFELFDADISTSAHSGSGCGDAQAIQYSDLSAEQITALGRAFAEASGTGNWGMGSAEAESVVDIVFWLEDAATLALTGTLSKWGSPTFLGMDVELTVVGSDPFFLLDISSAPTTLDESWMLERGLYRFQARTEASAHWSETPDEEWAEFDLQLSVVPEPGTLAILLLGGLAARPRSIRGARSRH